MKDDEKKKVSYGELVRLLQGSVAVEKEGRVYDRAEFLEAAQELGLDASVAAEKFDAHLARRSSVELAPRPFDTAIALDVGPQHLTLEIPRPRLSASNVVPVGVAATVYLGMTGTGAVLAAQSSWFIAVACGALAVFGVCVLTGMVGVLLRSTKLSLGPGEGTIAFSPFWRKRKLRTRELKASVGPEPRLYDTTDENGRVQVPMSVVLLEHGTSTLVLLRYYSEQEQRWIASELEAWLRSG